MDTLPVKLASPSTYNFFPIAASAPIPILDVVLIPTASVLHSPAAPPPPELLLKTHL